MEIHNVALFLKYTFCHIIQAYSQGWRWFSMEIDFKKIGQRIQQVRKNRRMTQAELADICDCSVNHLSAVENGTNRPSMELIIKISSVLNESVDYFLMDVPHTGKKYLIDSQIAKKLDACSDDTLKVVDSLLDSMLEYQKNVSKKEEH